MSGWYVVLDLCVIVVSAILVEQTNPRQLLVRELAVVVFWFAAIAFTPLLFLWTTQP